MKDVRTTGDSKVGASGIDAGGGGSPGKRTLTEQVVFGTTSLGGDGAQAAQPDLGGGGGGDVENPMAGSGAVANGPGKPRVTLTMPESAAPPLTFSAPDYRALYTQVSARVGKEAGSVTTALTTDTQTGADGNVTSVAFSSPLQTMLPEWTEKATQPPADQAKFGAWRGSVSAHEAEHRAIYKREYAKLKTQVVGPAQADVDAQATAVTTAAEQVQDAFDASNQPAPLAAPGGIEKVQSTDASDAMPPSDTALA